MRAIAFMLMFLSPLIVSADEFHTLVRYTCDAKQDRLTVEYLGAYNEAGEELDKFKGKDAWSPSDLRGLQPSDPVFSSAKTIKRDCRLSNGSYLLEIKPVPEDLSNIMGHCGDWETAWARLTKDKNTVFEQQFESSCDDVHSLVITKIEVEAGKLPVITRIQQQEFLNGKGVLTQSQMNASTKNDFNAADQELNRIYKQLMSSITEVKKKELLKEQRAWLKNRDPQCRKEVNDDAGGGSAWSMSYSACRAISTRERVEELKKWGL